MTSSKIKSRKTPEQRKAEADALQASIAAQVEQLRDSDQWKAFLAFAGSFHNYSLNNFLLIHAQRPDATAVAGFGGALAYSIVHYSLIFAGDHAG